jgi:hypothetical protein
MTVSIHIFSGRLLFWDCRQRVVSSMVVIICRASSSMPVAERTLTEAILDISTPTSVTFAAPNLVDWYDKRSGIDQ